MYAIINTYNTQYLSVQQEQVTLVQCAQQIISTRATNQIWLRIPPKIWTVVILWGNKFYHLVFRSTNNIVSTFSTCRNRETDQIPFIAWLTLAGLIFGQTVALVIWLVSEDPDVTAKQRRLCWKWPAAQWKHMRKTQQNNEVFPVPLNWSFLNALMAFLGLWKHTSYFLNYPCSPALLLLQPRHLWQTPRHSFGDRDVVCRGICICRI